MAINLRARSEAFPGYKTKWGFGRYYFAAQGTDLDHSKKADKVDGSGFGQEFKNEPPGMKEGNLKFSGLASMKRGHITQVLDQRAGRVTPTNVWYCTEGLAAGAPIAMQPSYLTDHSIKAKLKDSVTFDAEFSAAGASDLGTILYSPLTLASGTTVTGPEDDNTVASGGTGATTFGYSAQLHVLAVDGGTTPTVVVKIQGSPDGETFTDIPGLTFASLSAPGDQRLEVPIGVTIPATLQATIALTGTPTGVQLILGGARGVDYDA